MTEHNELKEKFNEGINKYIIDKKDKLEEYINRMSYNRVSKPNFIFYHKLYQDTTDLTEQFNIDYLDDINLTYNTPVSDFSLKLPLIDNEMPSINIPLIDNEMPSINIPLIFH